MLARLALIVGAVVASASKLRGRGTSDLASTSESEVTFEDQTGFGHSVDTIQQYDMSSVLEHAQSPAQLCDGYVSSAPGWATMIYCRDAALVIDDLYRRAWYGLKTCRESSQVNINIGYETNGNGDQETDCGKLLENTEAALQGKYEQMMSELQQTFQSGVAESEQEIKNHYSEQFEELKRSLEENYQELSSALEKHHGEFDDAKAGLESQLESAQRELSTCESAHGDATSDLASAKKEIASLKLELDKAAAEREGPMRDDLKTAQNDLAAERAVTDANANRKECDDNLDRVAQAISTVADQMGKLTAENAVLTTTNDKLAQDLERCQTSGLADRWQATAERWEEAAKNYLADVSNATDENIELSLRNEELELNLEKCKTHAHCALQDWQLAECRGNLASCMAASAPTAGPAPEGASAPEAAAAVTQDNLWEEERVASAALRADRDHLRTRVANLTNVVNDFKDQFLAAYENVDALKTAKLLLNQTLLGEVSSLRDEISRFDSDLEQLQTRKTKCDASRRSQIEANVELRRQYDELKDKS